MYTKTLVLSCGAALLCIGANAGEPVQLVTQVQRAETQRESDVRQIVSTRRYVLKNKRWDQDAVMHVRVTSKAGVDKTFEIVSIENAQGLQKRVFQKLLDAEIEASRKVSHEAESAVTPDNYEFTELGTEMLRGRRCLVVQLTPKRSSKYLIQGKAWFDPEERALIRVEGRTAKSVSFWIGRPHIVQDFRKFNGMWLSSANRSFSDVKLIGRTELSVDFTDYNIERRTHEIAQIRD